MINRLMTALVAITFSVAAVAQSDEQNPYDLVQAVASQTFDRMKREKEMIAQDPEQLRLIMKEELLPHIDYQWAAFKVLGDNFKDVPKKKIPVYVKVFREYLITTYAVAMGYYDDQEVVFEPAKSLTKAKSATVRVVIKDDSRPDINIAFRVRKSSKTKKWKAWDMVAEGISLVDSKRSEFSSILRKEGIDKIIEIMQNTIDRPIKLETDDAEQASTEEAA